MKRFLALATSAAMLASTFALATPAFAATPNWTLNAPTGLTFMCSSSPYAHTLNTVANNPDGSFSGTGSYNADSSYIWNITGNVSGDTVTFTLVYTGSNAGYTLTGTGTIASNGSISGTITSGNCESFSMPAGSATPIAPPVQCPAGTTKALSPEQTITVNANNPSPTVSAALTNGTTYLVQSSGTWTNSNLNVADAEYASTDNWSSVMDGWSGAPYFLGTSEFDLEVNGGFINWGSYNTSHTYSTLLAGTGATASFLIFDGDSNAGPAAINPSWYGDNSGSLTVNLYPCIPNTVNYVTGGGNYKPSKTVFWTFGGNVWQSGTGAVGSFELVDHSTNTAYHFDTFSGLTVSNGGKTASFHATGWSQGKTKAPVSADFNITDNGEPGKNDSINVSISNGSSFSAAALTGGNFQVGQQ